MSASLKTANFQLPIYTNNDTIAYIPDWNSAMRKVDEQMEANSQKSDGAISDTENLRNLYTALASEVATLTSIANNSHFSRITDIEMSPGIGILYTQGVKNSNIAIMTGVVSSKANYINEGAIHFKYNDNFEFIQIGTYPGNPFSVATGTDKPEILGVVYGEIIEDVEARIISHAILNGLLFAAYENNITFLYVAIHNSDLGKMFFATFNTVKIMNNSYHS